MKLCGELVRSKTVLVFAAVIILLLAIGSLVKICVASGKSVSYQALMEKLPEMQERTQTKVVASTRGALDLTQLPIAYRIGDSISSLPIFSKGQPLGSKRWTETWEIQADGNSLSVSLLVLRDRVSMVILKSVPNSGATDRWSAIFADLFPSLRQRRVAL